jgi:hypothetical protein
MSQPDRQPRRSPPRCPASAFTIRPGREGCSPPPRGFEEGKRALLPRRSGAQSDRSRPMNHHRPPRLFSSRRVRLSMKITLYDRGKVEGPTVEGPTMEAQHAEIPGVTDDPVLRLIIEGRAQSLDDAEELYLDESIPQVLELLRSPITDDELARHPLLLLLRVRGSRGREDSLL